MKSANCISTTGLIPIRAAPMAAPLNPGGIDPFQGLSSLWQGALLCKRLCLINLFCDAAVNPLQFLLHRLLAREEVLLHIHNGVLLFPLFKQFPRDILGGIML